MTTQFDAMGKAELRAACKAFGIKYGSLNNDGMRAALVAHQAANPEQHMPVTEYMQTPVNDTPTKQEVQGEQVADSNNPPVNANPDANRYQREEQAARAMVAAGLDIATLGQGGVEPEGVQEGEGYCPHCFSHRSNGFADYHYIAEGSEKDASKMKRLYTCLGCGGEWGPLIERTPAPEPKGKGIKIEKDRARQNEVSHPSSGGACSEIWDTLDAMREADDGNVPTAKQIRNVGEHEGWNRHTTMIQYYQWRKFHGISGRQK